MWPQNHVELVDVSGAKLLKLSAVLYRLRNIFLVHCSVSRRQVVSNYLPKFQKAQMFVSPSVSWNFQCGTYHLLRSLWNTWLCTKSIISFILKFRCENFMTKASFIRQFVAARPSSSEPIKCFLIVLYSRCSRYFSHLDYISAID